MDERLLCANEDLTIPGLSLAPNDLALLVCERADALADTGRVEFAEGPLEALSTALVNSVFLDQDDLALQLSDLQRAFYRLKGDTADEFGDETCVTLLAAAFEEAQGDVNLAFELVLEELRHEPAGGGHPQRATSTSVCVGIASGVCAGKWGHPQRATSTSVCAWDAYDRLCSLTYVVGQQGGDEHSSRASRGCRRSGFSRHLERVLSQSSARRNPRTSSGSVPLSRLLCLPRGQCGIRSQASAAPSKATSRAFWPRRCRATSITSLFIRWMRACWALTTYTSTCEDSGWRTTFSVVSMPSRASGSLTMSCPNGRSSWQTSSHPSPKGRSASPSAGTTHVRSCALMTYDGMHPVRFSPCRWPRAGVLSSLPQTVSPRPWGCATRAAEPISKGSRRTCSHGWSRWARGCLSNARGTRATHRSA